MGLLFSLPSYLAMAYKRFVQVGRVVLINYGPGLGKLAAITEIIDQNRVQVDGPCSGVSRQVINLKRLSLTDFVIDISFGARQKTVAKAWAKADVNAKWEKTAWAQKRAAKAYRAEMTDFDRVKLMLAKKKRSHVLNAESSRLMKEAKKA